MTGKHEWIVEDKSIHCSECGFEISGDQFSYHYCPNCGDRKTRIIDIRENVEILERFRQSFDEVHVYESRALEPVNIYTSFVGLNGFMVDPIQSSCGKYCTNLSVYTNGASESHEECHDLGHSTNDDTSNCYMVADREVISNATFIVIYNDDKSYSALMCSKYLTDKDIEDINHSIDEHNDEIANGV